MKNKKSYVLSVIIVSLIIALFCFAANHSAVNDLYAKSAVITHINYLTDIVTIQDSNGFCWNFKGCEDWQIGDHCACVMNDKGTQQIFDDEIISIKYENNY